MKPGDTAASPAEIDVSRPPRTLWQTCRQRKPAALAVTLLLLLHAALAYQTAAYCSVTHDEYWHIPVGLLHWRTGRFDWENLNPPLIRLIAAAPLTVTANPGTLDQPTDQIWSYGDDFARANPGRYRALLIQARLPIIALSLLTAWVLGTWATEMMGPRAGVFAVFLWTVSPTVLASASLATTDLGAALCFALTGWRVWKLAQHPGRRNAILLGIALGLAQLAKFTSVILWPLSLFLCLLFHLAAKHRRDRTEPETGRQQTPAFRRTAVAWLSAAVISVVVLNAGYLFHGTGTALHGYRFSSVVMQSVQSVSGLLGRLPVPVPSDWLQGIDHQRQMMEADHPVFLNGEWSLSGFRDYYLHVLWYKLPHAIHVLMLIACWQLWKNRWRRGALPQAAALLLPVAVLLLLASGSGMQLGIRYLLPGVPFAHVFMAGTASWLPRRLTIGQTAAAVALVTGLLAPLRHHPHHLAHFNELAGGPRNGWQLLSDSNIDWGQDLYGLRDWIEANQIQSLHLAWFGTQPPSAAGIQARRIRSPLRTGQLPEPGYYAVSVCLLQGRPTPVWEPDGVQRAADFDEFGWLRFFEPTARIGWSVHIYELTPADTQRLAAQLRQAARSR